MSINVRSRASSVVTAATPESPVDSPAPTPSTPVPAADTLLRVDGKSPAPPAPVDAAGVRVATLGQSLTRLAGAAEHTTAADASARGGLHLGAVLTSTPSPMGPPTPSETGGVTGGTFAHGGEVAWNRVVRDDTGSLVDTGVSATLARANVAVDVTRTVAGRRVMGGISAERGYVDASGSLRWATRDGGTRQAGAFVGATAGSLFVGGSLRAAGASGPTGVASGFGQIDASRAVRDLGEDTTGNPALMGTRGLELRTSAGGGGVLAPGMALGVIGVGGRLTVDKSKAVVFRTHLPPDEARALLTERGGVTGFLRDKGRALGVTAEPVKLPDLGDPATLRVGDELIVSTSGGLLGGLALGAAGFRAGVEGITQGDFEIAVKKVDATHVQVVVTPTDVRGLELFLDTALVIEAHADKTSAAALRQAFTFDLARPGALAAYRDAVAGRLPSGLSAAAARHADARGLIDLVRHEVLPDGVQRDFLEQAHLRRSGAGGGLSWGVIESGSIAGLALNVTRSDETSIVTDGRGALETHTRGVERRREVLLSGTETAGIHASTRRVTELDAAGNATEAFIGLTLTARFADDRVRGLELNDEVIDRLNDALGTSLGHFARDGHNQARTISVGRTLAAADLDALAALPRERLTAAAEQAGVKARRARGLGEELAASADVDARAAAVQRFVAEAGLDGFGMVQRLLGHPEALAVSSSTNVYDDALQTAESLRFRYPAPVSASDTADDVTRRCAEIRKALKGAEQALADVADDVFLSTADRDATAKRLRDAQAATAALFNVDGLQPAERRALFDALERGWTTSDEQAAMDALARAGLG